MRYFAELSMQVSKATNVRLISPRRYCDGDQTAKLRAAGHDTVSAKLLFLLCSAGESQSACVLHSFSHDDAHLGAGRDSAYMQCMLNQIR